MLASIIIPAFRAIDSVPLAINSALMQTWPDIEVIVVDDASGDMTAAAAEKAAAGDSRVRVLRLASNQGAAGARNAGLKDARGEWIAFLDADDTFVGDRLARLILEGVRRGADLVADNLLVSWASGKYPDHLAFPAHRMMQLDAVTATSFAASDRPRWGLRAAGYMKPIFRKQFLTTNDLWYPTGLRRNEDFHFFMQCLLRGGVLHYVDYAGYRYIVRANSLSGSGQFQVETRIGSNRRLMQDAIEGNDLKASDELRRREVDLARWNDCLQIRDAIGSRRFGSAANVFWRTPGKGYVLARIAEKAGKDIAFRFGRTKY